MNERARIRATVREAGLQVYLHHDGLFFRVTWTTITAQIPSAGKPVLLKRPLQYPVAYQLKRVEIYRYPQGTELLGYADAESREVRG